jgi:hypothetical protein
MLVKCFEHFAGGVITEDEYHIFKATFNNQVREAENSIASLRAELDRIEDDKRGMEHLERFKEYENITELSRRAVATLIKSITVFGGKEFQITFLYAANSYETVIGHERAVV